MPANLPPQYYEAERRYREAKIVEDKIEALREMMAIMPKHKGTDKLRADHRKKLSKLLEESQKRPKKLGRGLDHIPREGIAQVVLVGPPNSGKSSFLNLVTNAESIVADYPFSTSMPSVGMMTFEDIQIQLVDLPPIWKSTESWVYNLIRNCDLALIFLDLSSDNPGEDLFSLLEQFKERKIIITQKKEEQDEESSYRQIPGIVICNKSDLSDSPSKIKNIEDVSNKLKIILISTLNHTNIDETKRIIFDSLSLIRVYTKKPGYPPDLKQPYILPVGSTMLDVVSAIHKDLIKFLKFARIWSKDGLIKGMPIEKGYIVKDGDILEFHR